MRSFYDDCKKSADEYLLIKTQELLDIISQKNISAFIGFLNSIRQYPQRDTKAIFEAASLLRNQGFEATEKLWSAQISPSARYY